MLHQEAIQDECLSSYLSEKDSSCWQTIDTNVGFSHNTAQHSRFDVAYFQCLGLVMTFGTPALEASLAQALGQTSSGMREVGTSGNTLSILNCTKGSERDGWGEGIIYSVPRFVPHNCLISRPVTSGGAQSCSLCPTNTFND